MRASSHQAVWPFFRLAFRPLFWLGALFGALSVTLWSLIFFGKIAYQPFGGGLFWHIHEMLFGFTIAIMTGFLLTAVQNWTGMPGISGIKLFALVLLWLLARLALFFPSDLPIPLIITLDLAYLPLAAFFLARPVIKVKMWRNLIFVPILLLMATLNGCMYYALLADTTMTFIQVSHTMILLISLVMVILGGRVFPMFTANGTHTERVTAIPWLEKSSVLSVIVGIVVISGLFELPAAIEFTVFLTAGVLNLARALRWRIWVTFKVPLVWSLHLSYWALCIGFILIALYRIGVISHSSIAFHAITVGGICMMILAMISRVSLGHTGRPIIVGRSMTTALVFIGLAFVTRVLAPLAMDYYTELVSLSAIFWLAAYTLFLVVYAPIMFRARIDGRPG